MGATTLRFEPGSVPECRVQDCDGDGVENYKEMGDADMDGWPDAFDVDADNDGVTDNNDNCPWVANSGQSDIDADGIGDVCDCADPPIIVLENEIVYTTICRPEEGHVKIEAPQVSDTCSGRDKIVLEGFLIAPNGVQVGSIDVEENGIVMDEGVNIVRWVATDEGGSYSTVEQEYVVKFAAELECCEALPVIEGSERDDQFSVTEESVCILAGGGRDRVSMEGIGDDMIYLGDGDDIMIGRIGRSIIVAGDGNDIIYFNCGGETYGGSGNDTIKCFGHGDTFVSGGTGRDLVVLGSGNDAVYPGAGGGYFDMGDGTDAVIYKAREEMDAWTILRGGEGEDTLFLPPGVKKDELARLGVVVIGFENIKESDRE